MRVTPRSAYFSPSTPTVWKKRLKHTYLGILAAVRVAAEVFRNNLHSNIAQEKLQHIIASGQLSMEECAEEHSSINT
jgi:hypothetical protein